MLLLVVLSRPAAADAHAAAPQVRIALDDAGALSLRLGDDELLAASPPKLYFFDWVDNGEPTRPDFSWMTKAMCAYDPETKTVTASHNWGRFSVTWAPDEDRVDLTVAVLNDTDKQIAEMHLWLTAGFQFPETPKGYRWSKRWAVMGGADRTGAMRPAAAVADYGRASIVACLPENDRLAAIGFGGGDKPRLVLDLFNIAPGGTRTIRASLRVGAGSDAGADPFALARDVYADFAKRHPLTLDWPDRRPIAALHPSSSHLGAGTVGETTNPRGWIVGTPQEPIDVTTDRGRKHFKAKMMDFANRSVEMCKKMDAQGMICWSLEGQQYPHTISYIGCPHHLAEFAPEMEQIADEWFQVFRDAGLKTGVTLSSHELSINPKHDPQGPLNKAPFKYYHEHLWSEAGDVDEAAIIEMLDKKISYANQRWGCTIYYVDANVNCRYERDKETGQLRQTDQRLHDSTIYFELARRHPDCLIIPEHESFLHWSCSAPLGSTPSDIQAVWPDAFSVNLMQFFYQHCEDPDTVERIGQLVRRGDILLFPGWYDAKENRVIKQVYDRNHVPRWHGNTAK